VLTAILVRHVVLPVGMPAAAECRTQDAVGGPNLPAARRSAREREARI
jgi:hypothetical protein